MREKSRKKQPTLDLATAARSLRRAVAALGSSDDPAGQLAARALRNVELRLASGQLVAALVLHSAQTVSGRRWQLRRAGRVFRTWPAEGPEAVTIEEARLWSQEWAQEMDAELIDKTAKKT